MWFLSSDFTTRPDFVEVTLRSAKNGLIGPAVKFRGGVEYASGVDKTYGYNADVAC